ncbi:DUF4349 domain-containing protein [Chitinophaga pinensis]|uniref:DUF4349 domain-containing protein n=1 Tax=Chitinophaga pinensis (strain ATCC 43595 / DSM 2588 / LMG 13176 / NBRC 15968 / NCIMB 11800 / UQM 2034) TaxID=485918 RepID=A0A979G3V6_CHIPD|nr:DUF4349 domain-containing protein [Chitinophaga pinensis]ACU60103.1 hypothetical protein Cpin_2621 [Chitinophaga pinensis DSM 2588]
MRVPLYYMAPVVLLTAACSSGSNHHSYSEAADSAAISMNEVAQAADSTGFTNDISSVNSPSRKRIRTADVRCRVSSVFNAVSTLEHAVRSVDGMVSESVMQNESVVIRDIAYSADSLKRIELFTPTANLTLRVPAASLDSVVHTLTGMATFIDYRTLKDEDKTLNYLSNAMKNNKPAPAVVKPAAKGTTLDVAQYKDQKYETETDRRIQNLAILDDVHYATFTVQLFQPQQADEQIIVNPERVTRAQFGTEFLLAVRSGFESFGALFIFLVSCWPYLILLALGLFIYRKTLRKKLSPQ